MRIVPLPPDGELEKLLCGLTQREVKVGSAQAAPTGPVAVALYRTGDPVQELAALFELPLAGSLAASLTLVPAGAVSDDLRDGTLEDSLRDNLAEIMNVLARFASMSGRRFVLVRHWCPPEPPDAAVMKAAAAAEETRLVAVAIPGYFGGRIAFDTL